MKRNLLIDLGIVFLVVTACSVVLHFFLRDEDRDGTFDFLDNCPKYSNPDQADPDADRLGDICDNCPDNFNPDQTDADGDRKGTVCDDQETRLLPKAASDPQHFREGQGKIVSVDDGYFLVWVREESWGCSEGIKDWICSKIYGAFVSHSGEIQPPEGKLLSSGVGFETSPTVAWNGEKLLMAWEKRESVVQDNGKEEAGDSNIYGVLFSVEQQKIKQEALLTITDAPAHQHDPKVAWDGKHFLIVWEDEKAQRCQETRTCESDIFGMRLDPNAGKEHEEFFVIDREEGKKEYLNLACQQQLCFATWIYKGEQLRLACIETGNDQLIRETQTIGKAEDTWPKEPTLAMNEKGVFLAWSQRSEDKQFSDIYGIQISTDGKLDQAPTILDEGAEDLGYNKSVPQIFIHQNRFWVVSEAISYFHSFLSLTSIYPSKTILIPFQSYRLKDYPYALRSLTSVAAGVHGIIFIAIEVRHDWGINALALMRVQTDLLGEKGEE